MIPILTAQQIREADQYTIANEPISSIDLMERASKAFVDAFFIKYPIQNLGRVMIFAGVGNNGGDALAIARLIAEKGNDVKVFLIGDTSKGKDNFKINFKRLKGLCDIRIIRSTSDIPFVHGNDVIVDGIFGSGLSREVVGLHKEIIDKINDFDCDKVSIDISSGLSTDATDMPKVAIESDLTITFQIPKWPFLQPSFSKWVGELVVVDIGLSSSFIDSMEASYYLNERSDFKRISRPVFSHKGSAGRVLLVAGSRGKMGAAVLASRAVLRSGAGLLFVHSPNCGLQILQCSIPEAMVLEEEHEEVVSEIEIPENVNAVAVGPGIGKNPTTRKALVKLFKAVNKPIIIDADAINFIAAHEDLLNAVPAGSVLTPHPGEFERLVGEWTSEKEKLEKLKSLCIRYKVHVVLKGAFSAICNSQGEIVFNSTGNPGMATGGSGDVLTGVITGIMAQGYSPEESLKLGVYIHGLAGDLAKNKLGRTGLIASDIVDFLPAAFKSLEKR
ncbi:MAG: NAD(P)H-hydrate dehydratase [Cyclobacteriaceae bacterium]